MVYWKIMGMIGILMSLTSCNHRNIQNNLSEVSEGISYVSVMEKELESIQEKTNTERANFIAEKIGIFPELERSVVFVEGHTAIIGITLQTGHTKEKESSVLKQVREMAKQIDPSIKIVSATTNPYLIELIENLNIK